MSRNYIVAIVVVIAAGVGLFLAVNDSSGGGDVVATVNGDDITLQEVNALLQLNEEEVDGTIFLSRLRGVIYDRVIAEQADAQFGATRTDAEVAARVDEIVGPLTESGVALEDVLASNNLTEAGLEAVAGQSVLQDKVEAALVAALPEPSEEELQARFNAASASLANVCSSHILLETEEAAQAAIDRANGGEDFAELAMELSTGPSGPNGGDLGCSAPGNFVAEFANATMQAPIGVPFGPVRTQFGFHVVLVSERTEPSYEEQRPALIEQIAAESRTELWSQWLVEILSAADVTVDPAYGTWTTDPVPTVVPPGA